jgi:hypothetical protein
MRDMQLRTHPKMEWEGFSNWPPVWTDSYGRANGFPLGEEGVLTGVEMNEASDTLPRHLTLTMMHLGNTSWAVLCCDDDENVIPRLYRILKGCIGREIGQIGDLDIDL